MSDPPLVTPSARPEPQSDVVLALRYTWFQKLSAILFVIFCLELGLFLVVYPWTESWKENLFATFLIDKLPRWNQYWDNLYFRGAVSGLGLFDLWVCVGEAFKLRRFSRH